jgi:hypothetical protein
MRKVILVVIAVLAIAPAALAQTYDGETGSRASRSKALTRGSVTLSGSLRARLRTASRSSRRRRRSPPGRRRRRSLGDGDPERLSAGTHTLKATGDADGATPLSASITASRARNSTAAADDEPAAPLPR